MASEQPTEAKPKAGTWDNMSTEEYDKHPKVDFPLNQEVIVQFTKEYKEPLEIPSRFGENEVFYVFNCKSENMDKSIVTSAWTLLRGLKNLQPLAGKTLKVKREMLKDGKQNYDIKEVS